MPAALKQDRRKPITYESALKKDANIVSQAAYLKAATELYIVMASGMSNAVRWPLRLTMTKARILTPRTTIPSLKYLQWAQG
jgi:hypothetical protein